MKEKTFEEEIRALKLDNSIQKIIIEKYRDAMHNIRTELGSCKSELRVVRFLLDDYHKIIEEIAMHSRMIEGKE